MGGAVQAARRAVQSGAIGMITGCHASVNLNIDMMYPIFRSLVQEGAGIGMDRGIYFLTAMCSIMGPIVEVCGFVRTLDPVRTIHPLGRPEIDEPIEIQNENQMVATIRFANGALGTLNFNGNCVFPEESALTIQGQEGILHLPNSNEFGGKVTLLRSGQWGDAPVYEEVEYESTYVTDCRGLGPAELAYAVRNGEPNRASKEMAFHMMEVLEAVVRSDKEKRSIRIDSRLAVPEGLETLGE